MSQATVTPCSCLCHGGSFRYRYRCLHYEAIHPVLGPPSPPYSLDRCGRPTVSHSHTVELSVSRRQLSLLLPLPVARNWRPPTRPTPRTRPAISMVGWLPGCVLGHRHTVELSTSQQLPLVWGRVRTTRRLLVYMEAEVDCGVERYTLVSAYSALRMRRQR